MILEIKCANNESDEISFGNLDHDGFCEIEIAGKYERPDAWLYIDQDRAIKIIAHLQHVFSLTTTEEE